MKESKLLSANEDEKIESLLELLRLEAAQDLGDFFTFIIGSTIFEIEAAPEGGSRFLVEVSVDGRSFEKFHLDVGIGDVWIEPLEKLESTDLLEFAGIRPHTFLAIPKEQQFAEKLHAYTLPRPEERPNSRVKDLVDMNLLIKAGLNSKMLMTALRETFKRRGSHELTLVLSPPPETWNKTYPTMATECGLKPDIKFGFLTVTEYLKSLK